jgi:hypothetical protein
MLCGTPKPGTFQRFSPTFQRSVFEKGLIRQFQRLALCPEGVLVGGTRGRHFSGTNFKPQKLLENAHAAKRQSHHHTCTVPNARFAMNCQAIQKSGASVAPAYPAPVARYRGCRGSGAHWVGRSPETQKFLCIIRSDRCKSMFVPLFYIDTFNQQPQKEYQFT